MNNREIQAAWKYHDGSNSISLSGKFQLQGQQALQGFLLRQSYINAQGGIAIRAGEKRAVRLIWHDDRSRINDVRENVVHLLRTVAELIQERDRISQAIAALESLDKSTPKKTGRRKGTRSLSAAAIQNIRRAQRARRKREKSGQSKARTPKRTMSASARRKIAAAQRAR
jgi:hypothetical protein